MAPLTRRSVLRLGSVALAGGAAGCLGSDRQSSTASRLAEVGAVNHTPNQQTAHVMILDGDEPVYWQSRQVSAADGDSLGGARFDGLPTEPEQYVVHARIDSQSASGWERFDCGEHDVSCLSLRVHIGRSEPTELSIWYSGDPSNCPDS